MPIPSVRLVRELLELSKTFRATPTLANANCDLLFPFHEAVPAVDAFAMGTSGVSEISLRRYMPSPAGLSDIDDKSAPSEVKAPPIPITRAVPKTCVCESCARSVAHNMSWFSTEPPNSRPVFCACKGAAATKAAHNATIFMLFIILSVLVATDCHNRVLRRPNCHRASRRRCNRRRSCRPANRHC